MFIRCVPVMQVYKVCTGNADPSLTKSTSIPMCHEYVVYISLVYSICIYPGAYTLISM